MDVKFMRMRNQEDTENIFHYNIKVSHGLLLKPLTYTFCKQPPFPQSFASSGYNQSLVVKDGFWCIAFEKFDFGILEWLERTRHRKKPVNFEKVYHEGGSLGEWWQSNIL